MATAMSKYPIFLELRGRRVVLVGGGAVAARKAGVLLEAGARLIVVAEQATGVLTTMCTQQGAKLIRSKYAKEYVAEAALVVAATNDAKVNRQVYADCQALGILCNVADDPECCDFFVPAVVKRGDLQIAISTEGSCPAYAGHLKKKLEAIFTEEHGQFLTALEQVRKQITDSLSDPAERKALLGELVDDKSFSYFCENGPAAWRKKAEESIESRKAKS
jgi:precorrin-2 dehydrogenase/sirohydrochlorin ferrochelatase